MEEIKMRTFTFRNLRNPGQQHSYCYNGQLVILKHGKKYTLPVDTVASLDTPWPDYVVEGDVDTEKTITRSDTPRFFMEPAQPDPLPEEQQKEKDDIVAQIVAKKSKVKSDEVVTE